METILGTKIWPESLIREVLEVIRPARTPEVYSISFRNKKSGLKYGNYGKFYRHDYRITLCVPEHRLFPIHEKRIVTRTPATFQTDIEYLVAVLAHEYWHAYQWINENHLYQSKDNYWLERGAEEREIVALDKWKDYLQLKGEQSI